MCINMLCVYLDQMSAVDSLSYSETVRALSTTSYDIETQLVPSDGSVNDFFGRSVSVYGNIIVVGSPGDDTAGGIDAGIYNHMNTISHQSINK